MVKTVSKNKVTECLGGSTKTSSATPLGHAHRRGSSVEGTIVRGKVILGLALGGITLGLAVITPPPLRTTRRPAY